MWRKGTKSFGNLSGFARKFDYFSQLCVEIAQLTDVLDLDGNTGIVA